MKLLTLLLTFGLALSTSAFAAKKEGKGSRKEIGAAIKAADKNGNHKIEADELAAFNEAFAKVSSESRLKKLDRDGDGKLSEDEIKPLNERLAKRGEGKKKKKTK